MSLLCSLLDYKLPGPVGKKYTLKKSFLYFSELQLVSQVATISPKKGAALTQA